MVHRVDRDLSIGVITVPRLYLDYEARAAGDRNYRSTTRDVRNLFADLKTRGIEGWVSDLRNKGGGSVPEATGLTGLFIKGGPVVQLRETGGTVEVLDDPEPEPAYTGPLAVLVDRFSASASEIFAAAIQDYGRGLVIGQQTYGKGTVQNLIPLDRFALGPKPEFGQLTITIGKFYRVTGDSTQNHGVTPDIVMPSLISADEVGENTRGSALPWDRIAAVPFNDRGNLAPAVTQLSRIHDQRAAVDPDFRSLVDDVASVDRLRQQTVVSLNLKVREQERTALDKERLRQPWVVEIRNDGDQVLQAASRWTATMPNSATARRIPVKSHCLLMLFWQGRILPRARAFYRAAAQAICPGIVSSGTGAL